MRKRIGAKSHNDTQVVGIGGITLFSNDLYSHFGYINCFLIIKKALRTILSAILNEQVLSCS